MTNKLLLLTKIFLKTGFRGAKISKGKKLNYIIFTLIGLSLLPLIIQYSSFIRSAYDVLSSIGQEGVIISLTVSISCMVITFFGIFIALSTFYFSKDIENLLPMPFKPFELIGAKFLTVVIYEYLIESIIFLPVILNYGIVSHANIYYYIISLLVMLLLPIIPLVISSFIAILLMSFTNLSRNKDKFAYFVGIIGITIGIGFNIILQKAATQGLEESKLREILMSSDNSLMNVISKLFPSALFASRSIAYDGYLNSLFNFLIYVVITSLGFLLFLLVSQKLYFRGVVGISDVSSKRKDLSDVELVKETRARSTMLSYILVETRILFRTPSYFINCVLVNIMFPILLIFFLIAGDSGIGRSLDQLKGFSDKEEGLIILQAALIGMSVFISGTNGITSTSLSREGKGLYFKKFIPLSYYEQIKAKIATGIIFSSAGIILFIIPLSIMLGFTIGIVLPSLPAAIAGMVFISMTGIFFDLNNPKLNWESEQAAVKQNLNLLMNMLVSVLVAAGIVAQAIIFKIGGSYNPYLVLILLMILDYVFFNYLKRNADRFFLRITA